MPQLIRPGDVKIITKDGECVVNINLELTIKLDGSGLQVSTVAEQAVQPGQSEKKDNVEWQIPNFSVGKKLNFGKDVS